MNRDINGAPYGHKVVLLFDNENGEENLYVKLYKIKITNQVQLGSRESRMEAGIRRTSSATTPPTRDRWSSL